jgi:signal transduction histidine kinase
MRNHLAIAVANIEAFIDGKLEPTPGRLAAVLQALQELDVLMNDIGPEERPARSELRTIDLCELLQSDLTSIEAAAEEKGIRLECRRCEQSHDDCREFKGDPVRIGQIVKNVLLNAIHYTPSGKLVSVDCSRGAGELRFSVSDQGPGVPPPEQERIFEAGYRGSASAGTNGSGLGLSIARQLAEEHGGTVEVHSDGRAGTTFTVRLPGGAAQDEAASSDALPGIPSIM